MSKEKTTAEKYMDKADRLFESNPSEAIELYLRAIKLDPRNYQCYLRAAGGYLKIRDFDQAIIYYDQAISLTEVRKNCLGNAICYYNKACVYVAKNDYNSSILCNNKAIEYDGPGNVKGFAYRNNAVCYIQLNNFNAASEQITKALEIEPNNPAFKDTAQAIYNNINNQQANYADRENIRRQANQNSACCIVM